MWSRSMVDTKKIIPVQLLCRVVTSVTHDSPSPNNNLKQFETILFPQDMIQDIYVTLEYMHKSTGVT